ncbi:class I SAM-dependent methyltransferase [Oryzifoliimicrobium ureilyticus]|uniref:class I SAM-dependent methyltransferase n=1 Tax=Oryzifoliimicrobium ureilyticus TaxID=3113724 RepID=UPI003075F105
MTTTLGEKIKAIIRANGPISVTDYFSLCLADPEYGYYATREPFGRLGDFVTAPEVSQLFGEMIGVFTVHAWQRHNTPANVRLVEVGPGRGTMMADMLRVIARLAPPLFDTMSVHLVETSQRLSDIQGETLADYSQKISWHKSFDDLPEGFTLLVANELFDAIPIRQFVKTANGFRERMVGLDINDDLTFAVGVAGLDPAALPEGANKAPVGTIFEIAPARQAVMQAICERLRSFHGSALAIDYGHLLTDFGDTLQAVRMHEFDPPLAHPGEADLTSHVDFEALAAVAEDCGVHVNGLLTQGELLVGLGILDRAAALGRDREAHTRSVLQTAVDRLAGEGEGRMGALFKAIAVSYPVIDVMPFNKID